MPRDKVGMQMRFKNVADLEALLFRGLEVDLDVTLRIDHRSLAFRSNHVRSMRQAGEIELFKIHSPLPGLGKRSRPCSRLSFSDDQSSPLNSPFRSHRGAILRRQAANSIEEPRQKFLHGSSSIREKCPREFPQPKAR